MTVSTLPEWQKRVIIEANDLREKLHKLREFISRNEEYQKLPEAHQLSFKKQAFHMNGYLAQLDYRIGLF